MNDTDKKRLEEIEARAAKASPAPWTYDADGGDEPDPQSGYQGYGPYNALFIDTEAAWRPVEDYPARPGLQASTVDADASFIASTRDDVPWLISHLKDAMERESRVRELHKNTRRCHAGKNCAPGSACMESFCLACGVDWPCSTIRLLEGEEDGDGASLRSVTAVKEDVC